MKEIVRVVKSGGKVGIFDGDYASLTFATDDPEEGKATDELIHGAIVTNPRVMRQMPQLLREADLEIVTAFPYVIAETGRADFWESAIQSLEKLLPKVPIVPLVICYTDLWLCPVPALPSACTAGGFAYHA